MGFKLLRDGMDSANFVSMFSVDGQADLNFFATDWIQTVGLSEMASWDQDGNAEASPLFPWMLHLVPSGEYEFASTVAEGYTDFRDDLMSITEGSTLWNVYAWDNPEELGGTEQLIAKIVTTSETTTSYWGDEHMYFRHERMDDDLAIRPEWVPYTPKYSFFSLEQIANEDSSCPFANLMQYLQ